MSASRKQARPISKRPLWRCPECSARFTTRNQQHACGKFELDALFARSEPHVRRIYERFLTLVRAHGPVTVIPQKSRIAIMVRMRFAALTPQKSALKGHLVLARRHPSSRFEKIETFSPRCHVHVFRLTKLADLDAGFIERIAEAYAVGRQDHLDR